jgi:glucosylceramidase
MEKLQWLYSNELTQWTKKEGRIISGVSPNLWLDSNEYQAMYGFGACLNELGFLALTRIGPQDQKQVLEDLFGIGDNQCGINFCRLPIGANDYSTGWYSLDEEPGDYALKKFSIDRDRKILIPYIRIIQSVVPNLNFFASPWSPPTWMKNPPVYNWGKLIQTKENLTAYAHYFVKYVEAYREEGITINQIHVQNEPVANQKFPSCMWTGEELRLFIRDYLGPAFEESGLDTEIWLGTINAPGCDFNQMIFDKWAVEDYDYFAHTVLSDQEALKYIAGVSYQWGGKIAIQRTFESWWPQIRLMQSENECGFGDNTWEYARYMWTMLKHYIGNGAESYIYWNLILEPWGYSTWGTPQNAMITVNPDTKQVQYNPDYYVMKHFSSSIRRGAIRLGIKGPMAGDALVFKNTDGTYTIEVFNPFNRVTPLLFSLYNRIYAFDLEPLSINSIII